MKIISSKSLACATLILISAGMPSFANGWTFYTSGTISSGTDYSGVFGTAGTNLSGESYSQLYTLDPSLYSTQIGGGPGDYVHGGNGTLSGTATDTITINGVSRTFTWDLSNLSNQHGESALSNAFTQLGSGIHNDLGNYDQAVQYQQGYTVGGQYLYGNSWVYSAVHAFNLGLSFDQVWSYKIQPGDGATDQFSLSGPVGSNTLYAELYSHPTFVSINTVSPVPEPQTYAMMLAGLGLIGFTTLRRKQNFAV